MSSTKKQLSLQEEAQRATKLLKNKKVSIVFRNREKEFGIEFSDGSRLFIDHTASGLDVSIT